MSWIERPAFRMSPQQAKRWVWGLAGAAVALATMGAIPRDILDPSEWLPPEVLRGGKVVDVLDVGKADSEKKHAMDIGEDLRVPRKYLDRHGYRIEDECGILRKGKTLKYDFAPLHDAGRLIVRTDSFYKGELLTRINGVAMPPAPLDPRQTIFVYLEIPIPAGQSDGGLHVEQEVNAQDVGLFTVWLVVGGG
jgi:hypothetical protein